MKTNRLIRGSALLAVLLVLAGCAVGPTYERPAAATPAAYKEAALPAAEAGTWKPAQPSEEALRGEWWKVFGDEGLNQLQEEAHKANQNLQAAAARLTQARAATRGPRRFLPQPGRRLRPQSPAPLGRIARLPDGTSTRPVTTWRAQGTVSYEADLFGRVASTADAATADAQQSEALYRSVLLALQADVATTYFLVREQDAEAALYRQTVQLRTETLQLIQRRYDAGDISELDLARAKAELASAQSEALGIDRRRAAGEHALAVLLGRAPSEFAMPPKPIEKVALSIPAGLPSTLLERRPDIAAAERAMAAANARVGAAKSAFFPRLDITGAFGYESSELGNLFQWSSRTFLLGPLVGAALSMPIFDGGRRQAGLDRARAVYEEDVAVYRQTVLNAFREVEDNLANLRILSDQTRAGRRGGSLGPRREAVAHAIPRRLDQLSRRDRS
ncbi:efflux transporter outer membrane subunit [Achromobacter xylosoxidans]